MIVRFIRERIGAKSLTQRDDKAPSLDNVFAEFGLPQPRPDCPTSIAGYPGFPYADGNLAEIYKVPPGEIVSPPYVAEMMKQYGGR